MAAILPLQTDKFLSPPVGYGIGLLINPRASVKFVKSGLSLVEILRRLSSCPFTETCTYILWWQALVG